MLSNSILYSPEEYADTAVIARTVGEEMLSRLDLMTLQPRTILDVGCGTGEMSAKLSQYYPAADVLAVDTALPMLQFAKGKSQVTKLISASGEQLPLRDESVDLIFANFILPWQSDIKAMLDEWQRVLSPDGLLMLTALGLDTLGEWREVLGVKHIPTCVDMHDVGDALVQAGFSDPVLDVDYYQVNYREQTRLLHDLRQSGMWFPADAEVPEPPQSPSALRLTYEVVFAHAFGQASKNEFSAASDGVVRIPLKHLRRGR